jgi:hypothetical protein
LEAFSTNNEEDNRKRSKLLSLLYGNLAEAYVELDKPEQACVACKKGLDLEIKESTPLLLRT